MTDAPFNPFTGGLTPTDVETVVGTLDDGTEIAEIMRQFYPILLDRAWTNAGQQVELGLAFDLRNPRVQETITGLAQKVRRVAESTREEVRAVLARVDAEGLSYQQAAKLLRGVVETAPDGTPIRPFDSAYRSFMIAVTESAYAYSRGQVLAWQESGEVDRMQWVAETNACPICRKLDGEVVILGAPFGNGLEVPAHPNCRCTLSPVLTDDFPLPAAPVSGPTAIPPQRRPASFTIRADGTLDYTPSSLAEEIYSRMRDPLTDINKQLLDVEAKMDMAQRQLNANFERQTKLSGLIARSRSQAKITQYIQELKTLRNEQTKFQTDIDQYVLDREAVLKTLNPNAVFSTSKPYIRTVMQPGVTQEQKEVMLARTQAALQILDAFIPATDANGQPLNSGMRGFQVNIDLQPIGYRSNMMWSGSGAFRYIANLDADENTGIVMHEILHAIHDINPTMKQRIAAFYTGRTQPGMPRSAAEQLLTLTGNPGYGPNEMSRPDSFATFYVGKEQPGIVGVEVLTMWAQDLMDTPSTKARRTWQEDPEWVKFCIDLLMDPGSYS